MKATHYNNSDGGMDDFGGIEDAEAAREALIDDDNYFYNQEGDYWNSNWEDASNSAAAAVASSGSGGSVLGGIVSGALDLVGKVWNLTEHRSRLGLWRRWVCCRPNPGHQSRYLDRQQCDSVHQCPDMADAIGNHSWKHHHLRGATV